MIHDYDKGKALEIIRKMGIDDKDIIKAKYLVHEWDENKVHPVWEDRKTTDSTEVYYKFDTDVKLSEGESLMLGYMDDLFNFQPVYPDSSGEWITRSEDELVESSVSRDFINKMRSAFIAFTEPTAGTKHKDKEELSKRLKKDGDAGARKLAEAVHLALKKEPKPLQRSVDDLLGNGTSKKIISPFLRGEVNDLLLPLIQAAFEAGQIYERTSADYRGMRDKAKAHHAFHSNAGEKGGRPKKTMDNLAWWEEQYVKNTLKYLHKTAQRLTYQEQLLALENAKPPLAYSKEENGEALYRFVGEFKKEDKEDGWMKTCSAIDRLKAVKKLWMESIDD